MASRVLSSRQVKAKQKKPTRIQVERKPPAMFKPDEFPEGTPFSIEVAGEPDVGKTHFACTFPKPLVIDTEGKAWIVLKKFGHKYWKKVKTFDDIRQAVYWGIDSPEIETIVIDSGADLRELAAREYMEEHGIEQIYPLVLWARVDDKIDELVRAIKDADKYLVVTARMKDEYLGEQKTGRRVRDGYKKFPWDLSMGIIIRFGLEDPKTKKVLWPKHRFGIVTKNNFYGADPKTGRTFQKPVLFDVSFEGVCEELLKPWHGEDGVPIGEEWDTIIRDFEEWLRRRG